MKYEHLGNIVDISKGKKHNHVETPTLNSMRIIGINDLRNDTIIVFTDDNNGVEAYEKDILIAWDGANAGTIGYGKKGYIGSTISRLRIKNNKKYSEIFLGKLLQSKFKYLRSKATGATIPHINRAALDSIKVPQFELSDQFLIAAVLTRAEKLIVKRKESIKALDELLKSAFMEMFGDPVRNEYGWEIKKLPQLVAKSKNSLKRGPFGGSLKKEIFVDEGYLVYEQNHALNNDYSFKRYFIDQKTFNDLKDFEVKEGDILISCSGVYLGKLSIVPKDTLPGIINQALLKVTLNNKEMKQIFFVYLFSNNAFKNRYITSNRGSGIPNLPPMPVIKNIGFITPPISLQNQFAAFVEKVEVLKAKYTQSLTDLENLYGSLSQQAFNGELDLSKVSLEIEKQVIELHGEVTGTSSVTGELPISKNTRVPS